MKQENNYYTPSIEEFYIGFEFEFYSVEGNLLHRKDDVTEWKSDKCDEDWLNILCSDYEHEDETIHEHYRVKYLDKEDIESLGFKHIGNAVDIWYVIEGRFDIGSWTCYRMQMHYGRTDHRMYIVAEDPPDDHKVFEGIIKNKSELIRLMKQLRIT